MLYYKNRQVNSHSLITNYNCSYNNKFKQIDSIKYECFYRMVYYTSLYYTNFYNCFQCVYSGTCHTKIYTKKITSCKSNYVVHILVFYMTTKQVKKVNSSN